MSAPKFYSLKVKEVRQETPDCVSVSFIVPVEWKETFRFTPGQYLTIKKEIGGKELRRSYSICTSPSENDLRVAIKKVEGGQFSGFANALLKAGDVLDVMPPMGKFSPRSNGKTNKHYMAVAVGSGITPIISIAKTVLEQEKESLFTLVFGNKNRENIIFRSEIEALQTKYAERFKVFHVMSREANENPLLNGRIDGEKITNFGSSWIDYSKLDEVFICGPEAMILTVRQQLIALHVTEEKLHIELFTSPEQPKSTHETWVKEHSNDEPAISQVTIVIEGEEYEFALPYNGDSILDAAMKLGANLPYACKGGVCCTCRAKIMEGKVDMEVNYALEKDEVAEGYILTCQSHPRSPKVLVDFDAR